MGRRWAIRTLNFKEIGCGSDILYNHGSDNLEPNSKYISGYAVLCSLLRGSPDFFFFLALQWEGVGLSQLEIERGQY